MKPDARADAVRVDVWLWSVRLFKSRSQATDACSGGHVRVNGERTKASKLVKPGDKVTVKGTERGERLVEVVETLTKRVGAPQAADAMIDHSPEPLPREVYRAPYRDRGAGRPTKRERRDITKLRGR